MKAALPRGSLDVGARPRAEGQQGGPGLPEEKNRAPTSLLQGGGGERWPRTPAGGLPGVLSGHMWGAGSWPGWRNLRGRDEPWAVGAAGQAEQGRGGQETGRAASGFILRVLPWRPGREQESGRFVEQPSCWSLQTGLEGQAEGWCHWEEADATPTAD